MSNGILLEMCVDSVESAIAAQQGGADRVELCANLLEGGTTPSIGTIVLARQTLTIDLNVIIRPRGGDFCYSDIEFEVMQYDVERAKRLGANGVVIGILKPDGEVDLERTAVLIASARPLSVTFHRAFDMSRDPFEALEALIHLGVDRILTSGQEASVLEGLDLITELIKQAGDRIIIMPGGGITPRNIRKIISQSGAKEIHVASMVSVDSPMQYRNQRVFMGGELRVPEYSQMITTAESVKKLIDAMHQKQG